MRINLHLYLFFFLSFSSLGQDNYSSYTIDSLFSESVDRLINKDYAYADKMMSAIILRIKELDPDKVPKVYNNKGIALYGIGNYSEGIKYYKLALETHKRNNSDTLYAQALLNLGMAYKEIGADSLASNTMYRAIYKFRELNLAIEESSVLNSLGNLYRDAQQYERSENYLTKALELQKKIGYEKGIAYTYHGLGMLMMQKAEYGLAKSYFRRALFLKDSLGLYLQSATTLAQLGVLFMNIGQCDSATYYLRESIKLRLNTDNPNKLNLALNNLHLGQLNLQCGDTTGSINYFLEAEKVLCKIGALKDLVLVYDGLLTAYNYEGNYEEALHTSLKLSKLKEQILSENNQKELARLSIQYDIKGYQQSIKLKALENSYLKSRNSILIVSSLLLIFLLGIVAILYRKNVQRKKEIEIQNGALIAKNENIVTLHDELSHRTNNFLTLLRGMLIGDRTPENKALLNLYLSRLDAMSEVQKHLIVAQNESLTSVNFKSYVLELIENSEILYSVTVPVTIQHNAKDLETSIVNYQTAVRIGIILNEFINNSVKHNDKTGNLYISIEFILSETSLKINYSDSGINTFHSANGDGLKLVKELLVPINGTIKFNFDNGFNAKISIFLK